MSEQANTKKYDVGSNYEIDINILEPNPRQVRKHFDEGAIEALAQSIKEDGLLQNITFTYHEGKHIVVAGERRLRAFKLLKERGEAMDKTGEVIKLQCMYVEGSLPKLALVENLFREDLTAVEYAESVRELKESADESLTQGALGKLLGLKRTTINGILSVANMPPAIKDRVRNIPEVSRDKLERISRIKGEKGQGKAVERLLEEIKTKNQAKGEVEDANSGHTVKRTRGAIFIGRIENIAKTLVATVWNGRMPDFSLKELEDVYARLEEIKKFAEGAIDKIRSEVGLNHEKKDQRKQKSKGSKKERSESTHPQVAKKSAADASQKDNSAPGVPAVEDKGFALQPGTKVKDGRVDQM